MYSGIFPCVWNRPDQFLLLALCTLSHRRTHGWNKPQYFHSLVKVRVKWLHDSVTRTQRAVQLLTKTFWDEKQAQVWDNRPRLALSSRGIHRILTELDLRSGVGCKLSKWRDLWATVDRSRFAYRHCDPNCQSDSKSQETTWKPYLLSMLGFTSNTMYT